MAQKAPSPTRDPQGLLADLEIAAAHASPGAPPGMLQTSMNLDASNLIDELLLEREQFHYALSEAETALQDLSDTALRLPCAWIEISAVGNILKASDSAALLLGVDACSERPQKNFFNCLDRLDLSRLRLEVAKLQPGKFCTLHDVEIRTANNSILLCSLNVSEPRARSSTHSTYVISISSNAGPSLANTPEELVNLLSSLGGRDVDVSTVEDLFGAVDATEDGSAVKRTSDSIHHSGLVTALRALELEVLVRQRPCNFIYKNESQADARDERTPSSFLIHKFPIYSSRGRLDSIGTFALPLTESLSSPVGPSGSSSDTNCHPHDHLTGCLTRSAILGVLEREVAQARRAGSAVSVALIDVDAFKEINDGMGHQAGDALLRAISQRMRASVGERGLVGRLSGDEFLIVLPAMQESDAQILLDTLLDHVRMPLPIVGTQVVVTCSSGIASFPAHARSGHELVRAADLALYRAKQTGRDRIFTFLPSLQKGKDRALKIVNSLHRAMAREEFRLVYQPQYELSGAQKIAGAEALIRWSDPDLGNVPPAEFIPIAEQCGMGLSLDLWVLKTALAQKAQWEAAGKSLVISINTSAKSYLSLGFADKILSLVHLNGINPQEVCIEVTESTLMQKAEASSENLSKLKDAGFRISIDDFGTGYSSLALIHDLSPDEIKIDRSFVEKIDGNDDRAKQPLEFIVSLAQAMKIQLVAEGIETERQRQWLINHDCNFGQGFLMSPPVDAKEIAV